MASAKTPLRQVTSAGSYKAGLYSLILPGTGQLLLGRRGEAKLSFFMALPFWLLFGGFAYALYAESHVATAIFSGIALIPNILSCAWAARPVYVALPATPAVQLVPCTACGVGLSVAATACPKCGHPVQRQQATNNAITRILLVTSVFGVLWWLWGGGYQWYMNSISRDVAADAVAQYRMVEKTGSNMDRCVQAGYVAAAYLQAKDQKNYDNWHWIEKSACMSAGVQK